MPYCNWCISIAITSSDGYRMQRLTLDLNDGWTGEDSCGCLETLGMTAAGLIKAVEASGISVYGGDPVEGFTEGYRDDVQEQDIIPVDSERDAG